MRVLIVDDSGMIREVMSAMVTRLGHEAVCVGDGAAALEMALEASAGADEFDLVLLDLELPDRPGTEVAQALREQGMTAPVYGISGHDGVTDRCREAGMAGNIRKPVRMDAVEAVLGVARAHRELGDDALVRVVIEGLRAELPTLLDSAERTDDVVELRRLAHTMRGALRYVDAPAARAAAARLEESAKQDEFEPEALADLRKAVDRLIPSLAELL